MELVVAMAVSAIVAVMATYFFINTFNTAGQTTDSTVQAAQARQAMQQWTQLIRLADSPIEPGATIGRFVQIGALRADGTPGEPAHVIFYANIGNRSGTAARTAPEQVTIGLENGALVAKRSGSTHLLAGCSAAITDAGNCITQARITNVAFTPYYPAADCPTDDLSSAGLCTVDAGKAAADIDDVVAVGFAFTVTGVGGHHGHVSHSYTSLASVTGGNA